MSKRIIALCLLMSGEIVQAKTPVPPPPQPAAEPDWSTVRRDSEAAIKASLVDPGSAQITWTKGFTWGFFKPPLDKHYYGWVGCGMINAKNRMGGYVGNTPFVIVYNNGVVYESVDQWIGCGTSPAPQAAFIDAPTSAATSGESVADELEKLANLRDRGVITDAEFQSQKAKLLQETPK